ncbi:cation diffusion facilitator family transporter [Phaeobacter piscinae]|uniref:cation diffusion facilitator family transporter n=1 Tax=Phaeobacter piscinae TaxID=1580596 RepID=UPI000BBEF68D|nr:cation diffusion facilitator family transporter [Phaeobacter piscinae]ATG40990.1 putative cation efflux pump [Phaeobacter piscinae]
MPKRLTAEQLATASIAVALLVLAAKVLAWWLTGSIALFSDAMESLVNIGGAIIAWFAVRYANRPADAGHPFGHHKAEYFSAVVEGIMIIVAALLILQEAVSALVAPTPLVWNTAGLWVNAAAMVINLLWARVLITRGAALKSPALAAGGRHLMSDVWTSAGVLIGLILAMGTGWSLLDPILALVVAVNILREGYLVVASSVGGLMDQAAPQNERDEIAAIIHRTAQGALQVHGLKTRRAGRAVFVEFHMVVAGDMTVRTSHAICDRIEEAIRASLSTAQVTIHVEPEHKLEDSGIQLGQ